VAAVRDGDAHEVIMKTKSNQSDGLAAAQHILACESCLDLMAFAFDEHDVDALKAWGRQLEEHLKAERGRVLR
jgi:hypothetical protein